MTFMCGTALVLGVTGGALWACEAPYQTVFACDLVAMPQRVEVCGLPEGDFTVEETYSFGVPGQMAELSFEATDVWGRPWPDGHVEIPGLSTWGIGLVHPNGTTYAVFAYGDYRDGVIRRGVLQVFASLEVFNAREAALFHAECQPETLEGDFDNFAP